MSKRGVYKDAMPYMWMFILMIVMATLVSCVLA